MSTHFSPGEHHSSPELRRPRAPTTVQEHLQKHAFGKSRLLQQNKTDMNFQANGPTPGPWRCRGGHVYNTSNRGTCFQGRFQSGTRESGGIGRRTRLRIWRVKPWGFESPLSHQFILAVVGSRANRLSPDRALVHGFLSRAPGHLLQCFQEINKFTIIQ